MEGSVTEQEESEKLIEKLSSSPRGEKVLKKFLRVLDRIFIRENSNVFLNSL